MKTKDQNQDREAGIGAKGHVSQKRILSYAAKVFAEEGYERASIRKIASQMGMSISALYYYFKSKEELLFSIQHQAFVCLIKDLEEKIINVKSAESRLYLLIENHLEFFLSRLNELTICSHEINTLSGDRYNEIEKIRRRYYNIANSIVNEIKKKRKGGALQSSLATLNLFGMLNWIYMWFDPHKKKPHKALAGEIYNLFLNGIKSTKRTGPNGHKT